MSEKQFEGKSAIVTGGTRGIGRAILLELARRGANVAFNDLTINEEAQKLVSDLEELGAKDYAAEGDVTNTEAAAEFVGQVKGAFGTVGLLVDHAGIRRAQLLCRMK